MESVFDRQANAALIERINKLNAAAPAQWGKMSVAQMVVHCQKPIEVAFGQGNLKRGVMAKLFGGIVKRKLLKPGPLGRNSPTAPGFKIEDPNIDFDQARQALVGMVQRFAQGHASISNDTHPFFGKMTMEEWDVLQWKHLDHHLRQFGA